ncbi:MAG: hypothetical protein EP343_19315 [Deltaproteobacteria bacterium]|nr:MAG: hypothetical protein EP343_19315 [Deltaproteobacteria bacterium]
MAWFRKLLFGNFLLKLFSLILAITLYVQIHKDTLVRATAVEVKLFFDYPSDLILTSGTVTNLKVTLQGPDSILKRLASKNLRYSLKLSDALPGSMQTELYTEQLRKIFPVSVRVIRVQPSLLDLTFAKISKKKLPIKIPTKGKPLFGYRLIQGQPIPRVVAVEGPEDIIVKLKEITSETIDLRGKYRDQVMVVKLLKPDKNVRFVGPLKVKVSLNFLQRKIKKVIKDVPVQLLDFLNNKLDVTLSPNKVDVTLIGPQSQLTPLKAKELIVTVDGSKISNKPAGIHQIPLQVKPPNPELKVIKVTPSAVVLSTKPRPTQDPPVPRRGATPKPQVLNVKTKPKQKRRKRVRRRKTKRRKANSKDDDDDDDDESKKKSRKRRKRRRKYRRRKKKRKKTGYRRRRRRLRRKAKRRPRRKRSQPKRALRRLAKGPKPSGRLPAPPRPKSKQRLGIRVAKKGTPQALSDAPLLHKKLSHKPHRTKRSTALTRPSRR